MIFDHMQEIIEFLGSSTILLSMLGLTIPLGAYIVVDLAFTVLDKISNRK